MKISKRARRDAKQLFRGCVVNGVLDDNRAQGLDASNRVLWEFGGLQKPLDVQWLEGGRVLVAEHDGNRVTERNPFTGEPSDT